MIARKTVLVLGAGASMPYGFPSGTGLIRQILALDGKTLIGTDFPRVNDELASLQQKLRDSKPSSIDLFLHLNPRLARIGKVAIASVILQGERRCLTAFTSQDRSTKPEDGDWYEFLWHQLHAGIHTRADLFKNDISVITFNYDTSLENYIFRRFLDLVQDTSGSQAEEFVCHLNIAHVFGSTGGLPFGRVRKFADSWSINASNRERIYDEIERDLLTIGEVDKVNKGHRERLRQMIKEAEKIIVLGFGCHMENMEIIGLKEFQKKSGPQFFSAYNEHPTNLQIILASLGVLNVSTVFWPVGHLLDFSSEITKLGCLDFLRETSALKA
ncbi:MAG: hypothetical protein JST51_11605 [Armatimonadetes bacterium]|nr:hypothetical protein [Armatimonadota bacterium]